MPPWNNIVTFEIAVIIIVALPGPSVLFIISRALTVGQRATLMTIVGNSAGITIQVFAAAFGIGALVTASEVAYRVLLYIGAAYLCYLGVQAVRHRRAMADALERQRSAITPRRALRDGFIVGATNPKSLVIFVSVMPGFAAPELGHVWLQLLFLGGLMWASGLAFDSVWALVASGAKKWFARSPRRSAAIGGAGGVVMIGIGASIAITGKVN